MVFALPKRLPAQLKVDTGCGSGSGGDDDDDKDGGGDDAAWWWCSP